MDLIPGESRIGHYIFEQKVGSGMFASVWLTTHSITRLKVAIKVIFKGIIQGDAEITRLTRELNFLKQMRHPFIAEFYEFIEDEQSIYYCMEYVEKGSLLNHILTHGALNETQVRHYFSQLVSVLEYLHSELRVCHRDVKAENMLLDRYNNLRVIDFGLSNAFTSSDPFLKSACGSPPYASPEMVKGQAYSNSADIWSSGILLYAMSTGLLPFDDQNIESLFRKIVSQDIQYPSFLSPALVDLLKKMLTKTPELRITLNEIKEHEWFSQTQYASLFAMHLGERSIEGFVDPEILEQMTQMGIETVSLRQQLLLGAYTELTAMYRMLRRERMTEHIRDVIVDLPAGGKRLSAARAAVRDPHRSGPERVMPVLLKRHVPVCSSPANAKPGYIQRQPIPMPVQIAARRLSRPLAVSRGCLPSGTSQSPRFTAERTQVFV
jgi:hypothetical protein